MPGRWTNRFCREIMAISSQNKCWTDIVVFFEVVKMRNTKIFLTVIAIALLAGCSPRLPVVDQYHGTAYRLALESELVNPDAGKELRPLSGLDGAAAVRVIERYEKGFEKPAAKTQNYSIVFEGASAK